MDFQRYLQAKRSVDDRALNRSVYAALTSHPLLQPRPLRVLEVGCGSGAMAERLLAWGTLEPNAGVHYVGIDSDAASIAAARERLAAPPGFTLEFRLDDLLRPPAPDAPPFDLLIAHAVLDLLHLPTALPLLRSRLRPGGLGWLTINFDGETIFEPEIDAALDTAIIAAYHSSMDARVTAGLPSGSSRTGRKLFAALPAAGFAILAAGPSDWVVYSQPAPGGTTGGATGGAGYVHDEAAFLRALVQMLADEPAVRTAVPAPQLAAWCTQRLAQIAAGSLTLIVHQLDFLVQAQPQGSRQPLRGVAGVE